MKEKKVGYVVLIGRPNAGKSTLINTIIGEKVNIVSPVPQTTQKSIRWIYTNEEMQIIFLDTPGMHISKNIWNESINLVAKNTLEQADIIIKCIDSSREQWAEQEKIDTLLEKIQKPMLSISLKSDISLKKNLSEEVLEISSLKEKGIQELLEKIKKLLPSGPQLYPDEYYTDQNIHTRISEIIREKIFLHTKEEIPHSCYISIEDIIDEKDTDILKIHANIYAETNSQKTILIGKKWKMLKIMGTEARKELEKIFERRIFLWLRIKVSPKWRKKEYIRKRVLSQD